jgi:hypothetical protein
MSNDHEKDRLTALARWLVSGTTTRAAKWELKERDLYTWGAAEGTVTIASRDRDGEPPYELALYNERGERADELTSELLDDDEPAPWNESLAELYRVARRSALGADEIIDALMDRLREGGADDASGSQRSFLRRGRPASADQESPATSPR